MLEVLPVPLGGVLTAPHWHAAPRFSAGQAFTKLLPSRRSLTFPVVSSNLLDLGRQR